jgi:hypothetical protein
MPILDRDLQYEEDILKRLGIAYAGLSWCELGNMSYNGKPAKLRYQEKGVNHTSIDINGLMNSLPLNLDNPIPKNLINKFDVIANYGTTEHIDNQYRVFLNVHEMAKVDCIMIHGVALIGNWPRHCRYYYSKQFFEELAQHNGYAVIDITLFTDGFYTYPRNAIICALRAEKNVPFMSSEAFASIGGLVDSGNTRKSGNYSIKHK